MTAQPSDSPQSATDETTESPTTESPATESPATGSPRTEAAGAPPEPGAAAEATAAQPADQPPADQPPADQPPADQPPADQPPADAVEPPPTEAATEVVDTPAAYADPAGDVVLEGAIATPEAPSPEPPPAEGGSGGEADKKGKRKKKGKGGGDVQAQSQPEKKKPAGPDPGAVIKRIGTTSEAALAYVKDPDPKLARMARKHREVVITEIPPVTAGALLGPDALCRHFLASAASGRYRDLFFLWELFVTFPEECKPVLAARQRAQEKARHKLQTATHLGLLGDAGRVAADIDRATGLPWRWMREILEPMGPAIRQRPQVLAAMRRRQPDYQVDLPSEPSDRWLAEAAHMRESGADVPDDIDALLGAHADRLPATVATLSMAQAQYPDRVPALIDRVDLQARDIAAILAWARDHGHGDQLVDRISETVKAAAATDRASGLAAWKAWHERGVEVPLPESLLAPTLDGLDIGRPESAELIKILVERGADLDPQKILDDVAADNRMRGEKAFEAFVCAGFDDVHLPLALEGNPMVRPETRCPACQAWTWVRPGLEKRCPRTDCALRAKVAATPEDAGLAVDAAIAAIDGGGVQTAAQDPVPSGAAQRPAAAPAPRPQAAPAAAQPPAAQPPAAQPPAAQPPAAQPPAAQPQLTEAPTGEVPAADPTAIDEPTAEERPDAASS